MKGIQILKTELLSDDWSMVKKVTFEITQQDGTTEQQTRELINRGDGPPFYYTTKKKKR